MDALHCDLNAVGGFDIRDRLITPDDMPKRVQHNDMPLPAVVRFSHQIIRDDEV